MLFYPNKPVALLDFVKEYQRICQEATDLFAEFDPCKIYDDECCQGRGHETHPSFCCAGCDYLSDTGCTVEAIWCKVWTCGAIEHSPKEFKRRLNILIKESSQLCHGNGGRYSMSHYLNAFYGEEEYEKWKTGKMKEINS